MPNVSHPYSSYGTVPFDTTITIMTPMLPSHIRQGPSAWQRVCSLLVGAVSLLLLLAAVALFIAAKKISTTLDINAQHSLSHTVQITLWITAGVAFAIFFVGLIGALTRFRPLLCCFSCLLIPLLVAFITAGVMVLLLDGAVNAGDTWKHDTEDIWKGLVTASNEDGNHWLCDVQKKLECSGWDVQQPGSGCCVPGKCYDTVSPPPWVALYCPSGCDAYTENYFQNTCMPIIQNDVHHYVVGASFVCFGSATLLFCLCCISMVLVCKSDRRLERISEYEYLSVPI